MNRGEGALPELPLREVGAGTRACAQQLSGNRHPCRISGHFSDSLPVAGVPVNGGSAAGRPSTPVSDGNLPRVLLGDAGERTVTPCAARRRQEKLFLPPDHDRGSFKGTGEHGQDRGHTQEALAGVCVWARCVFLSNTSRWR